MKKAYIILAHKNPDQLKRLVEQLDDGLSHFFIHIDKSSFINENMALFNNDKIIELVPGVKTQWGSFGLVEATLKAMAAVRNSNHDFERIILMSGQDYPIKSNEYINTFLNSSIHSVFISSCLLPNYEKWPSGGGMYRINKYFFGFSIFQKYFAKAINFLAAYLTKLQRLSHSEIRHFYGSQWWIIDNYALNFVLNYVSTHPAYTRFHKFTFAPDELFFQTILLNSTDERITESILNDNKMFMKWADSSSANPEVLAEKDFNEIQRSPALFARKFDNNVDTEILNMIDQKIRK